TGPWTRLVRLPNSSGLFPRHCSAGTAKADEKAHCTLTNQRSSTEEDLAMVLGLIPPVNQKWCVVSGRVFSSAQKPDIVRASATPGAVLYCSGTGRQGMDRRHWQQSRL